MFTRVRVSAAACLSTRSMRFAGRRRLKVMVLVLSIHLLYHSVSSRVNGTPRCSSSAQVARSHAPASSFRNSTTLHGIKHSPSSLSFNCALNCFRNSGLRLQKMSFPVAVLPTSFQRSA